METHPPTAGDPWATRPPTVADGRPHPSNVPRSWVATPPAQWERRNLLRWEVPRVPARGAESLQRGGAVVDTERMQWMHRHGTFRRVLQNHGRIFGTRWDIAAPQQVLSRDIARRTARYIVLNPVRAALHDPTCDLEARQPLVRPTDADAITATFEALASACASALRCRPEDRRRKAHPCRATFVALATAIGHPRPPQLAEACGVSRRAIPSLVRRASPAAVACAHRCLLDPRLRVWDTPAPRERPKRAG